MASGISTNRSAASASGHLTTDVADDSALRQRLKAGDGLAYETLVRRHGGRMLATARRFLRGEQDAADAVQDAFLAAFKAIANFKGDSQLGTWLHRIVVNTCLMRRRSQDRHPTISIDSLLPAFDETSHHARSVKSFRNSPSDALAAKELRNQVREQIDRLPEPFRAVLILRDIEEIDTDTAAGILGVSPGVIKTRLHRGAPSSANFVGADSWLCLAHVRMIRPSRELLSRELSSRDCAFRAFSRVCRISL